MFRNRVSEMFVRYQELQNKITVFVSQVDKVDMRARLILNAQVNTQMITFGIPTSSLSFNARLGLKTFESSPCPILIQCQVHLNGCCAYFYILFSNLFIAPSSSL